jgi:hypothetical protein
MWLRRGGRNRCGGRSANQVEDQYNRLEAAAGSFHPAIDTVTAVATPNREQRRNVALARPAGDADLPSYAPQASIISAQTDVPLRSVPSMATGKNLASCHNGLGSYGPWRGNGLGPARSGANRDGGYELPSRMSVLAYPGANQGSLPAGHPRTVAYTTGRRNPVSPALMQVHWPYCQTPALHLYRTVIRSKARSIERLYDRTVIR